MVVGIQADPEAPRGGDRHPGVEGKGGQGEGREQGVLVKHDDQDAREPEHLGARLQGQHVHDGFHLVDLVHLLRQVGGSVRAVPAQGETEGPAESRQDHRPFHPVTRPAGHDFRPGRGEGCDEGDQEEEDHDARQGDHGLAGRAMGHRMARMGLLGAPILENRSLDLRQGGLARVVPDEDAGHVVDGFPVEQGLGQHQEAGKTRQGQDGEEEPAPPQGQPEKAGEGTVGVEVGLVGRTFPEFRVHVVRALWVGMV